MTANLDGSTAVWRVLVTHKPGARQEDILSAFPKASSIFGDLKRATSEGLSKAYIANADVADAPIHYQHLGLTLGFADRETIDRLHTRASVRSVVKSDRIGFIHQVSMSEANPVSGLTWGLKMMGVNALWKQGLSGRGVAIGHLDTGIDVTHPALKGKLQSFAEWDLMGRRVKRPTVRDSGMHGTHTAATICGSRVRGRSVGVAPNATLCSGIVVDGGDTTARILGGLNWLIGLGVSIINLSAGYFGYTSVLASVVEVLKAKNVLPVFAIGDEGPNTSRSPANYSDALAIGAIDKNRHVAPFSSSQQFVRKLDPDKPDCVAPGEEVISAKVGGGWISMSGTSMAAPHVAGLAALLLEAKPSASASELQAAILGSCQGISGEPKLRYGRGTIESSRALALLSRVVPPRNE